MSFYEKYDLTKLIRDGDAKTFRAVENATGRIVFVHLFNPAGQDLPGVLRSGFEAGGKLGPPVIELGEFAGSSYAVTEVIEPFTGLRDWLGTRNAPPPVAQPVQDDFAKLFQTPPAPPEPPRSFEAPQAKPVPPPPTPPKPEPDEFEKLLRAPATTPPPAPPA